MNRKKQQVEFKKSLVLLGLKKIDSSSLFWSLSLCIYELSLELCEAHFA